MFTAPVFVPVFRVRAFFLGERGVLFLERVGDVFEEDQPEDDVLIFRRVHMTAQLISRRPERGLKPQISSAVRSLLRRFCHVGLHSMRLLVVRQVLCGKFFS